ncbi:hypothetical protein [Rufibacter hautae]|uniref:Uncharacterized protein n=1 Tax=Rufibacter hautae TaxID=2595005 RepID=A0A5B6TKI2_9BACT|nr:hypothetical protein [Rufibacter hautae]KAA3439885.1 hypothetical protein FOA19_04225 [Rufibacter hautae]
MTTRIHGVAEAEQKEYIKLESGTSLDFLVPAGLDLKSVLPEHRWKKHHLHAYVCHIINEKRIMGRKGEEENPYVHLCSKDLERMLTTKECKRVVLDLEEAGVIELDGEFRAGKEGRPGKCLGYRFTEVYASQRLYIETFHNRVLLRKVQASEAIILPEDETFRYLHRQLGRLGIDLQKAYKSVTGGGAF